MEKTTLKRWISKSGNEVAAIVINNQPYVLPGFSDESFELDKEYKVEYQEEYPGGKKKNRRLLVFYEGKLIYDSRPDLADIVRGEKSPPQSEQVTPPTPGKKTPTQSSGSNSGKTKYSSGTVDGHVKPVSPKRAARAPYNFVPLNDSVFKVEREEIPEFDRYHSDRFTGWIEMEIEALTPLYIRDTLNHDEAIKELEDRQKKQKYENPDFFSPNGKPQIPGSSLRGMVRSLVEILSYSKFQFFDKRKLYFRGLADQSNLRQYYNNRMTDPSLQGVAKYKVNAGYLKKVGFQYYIIPATVINGKQFRRFNGHHGLNHYKFKPLPNGNYIIRSGRKVNPRQRDKDVWEIFAPDFKAERVPLSEDDIYNYINDKTRGAKIDLIKECNFNELVPCFYVVNEVETGSSVAIGHTALFRISYLKSIGDLVRKEVHLDNEIIDITEAIFGKLEGDTFAGRVFFEDAFLAPGQQDVLMKTDNPYVLSGPKPTTFQHYLVQKDEDNRNLNHYDTETQIRGYKLYWHKSGENWIQTDKNAVNKFRTQYTLITPVKPGTRFVSRIRFENLSKIELGALLYALDLPDGCCHKLGMGKPLGLGSVKIRPALHLSNRVERYKSLFAEWKEHPAAATDIEDFKTAFARELSEQVFGETFESLWDTPRLQELKVMLDYEKGVELERKDETRYMKIQGENEFKFRKVLPTATQVAGMSEEGAKVKKITHVIKVEIERLWGKEGLNISWELEPDVNVLVGINGSGKTTLLKLIAQALNREAFLKDIVPPKKLTLICNDRFRVEYRDGRLVNSENFIAHPVFISTFDVDTQIEIATPESGEQDGKISTFLNNQFNTILSEWRNHFISLTQKEKDGRVRQKRMILKKYVDDLFQRTKKKIEFEPTFTINPRLLEQQKSGQKLPDDIYQTLIEIESSFSESPTISELFFILEKNINQETISNYESVILRCGELSELDTIICKLDDGTPIRLENLSTGEKQMLIILLTLLCQDEENIIILMDEPEISLHVEWQLNLIDIIRELKEQSQIILATHSPDILEKGWESRMVFMNSIINP